MPEIRISELTPAVAPSGGEILAIVQNNTTHKTTIDSLKPALVDNLSTGAPTWTTAGVLTAGHDIIAGGNDTGRVALTLNDGYGDANITFNHTGGVPDRSGSSARIVSSVDSTQEVLDFQLKGGVTAGSPVALTSVLKLYDYAIELLKPTTLSTNGTAQNSLVDKGYIDTALSGKSDVSHTHTQYSSTSHLHDSRYSQIGHTHTIGNITNLQTTLDGKIGETEINNAHFTFTNNTLSLKTIVEGQIATNAVTTTKIANANVTFAKLTDVIDDDTMATASATKLATSKSIKAYVDAKVGDLAGKTATTEATGIENTDNDTSIPTSAAVKAYVDAAINSSAITGLLSIPLSTNYPSYYIQGTVISGSLTGVWSGTGSKILTETITFGLRNLSTGSTIVASFYTLTENVANNGNSFSVTRTFTRANYTIPTSGLYQLAASSNFTTTSGVTATPPA